MVMEGLSIEGALLAIILGSMAGIIYSLRVLVLVERRIARIDMHIEKLTNRVLNEEVKIEAAEAKIEGQIKARKNKR